ncbi:hypothetical protein WK56_09415 [Burkholderia ubonensis]|nr:hypothetical protein WK56_09415 [Burkholderia ubonensis]
MIAYHGILQNFTALLQFVPIALLLLHDRSLVALSSWSWQLWALQGVSFAAVMAGLVSHVAVASRRRWGRTLGVAVWVALSVAEIMLSSWIMVLIGLPLGIVALALIYNRLSNDYLSLPRAAKGPQVRRCASFGLLAVSSALHYWAIAFATMRTGAFAYMLPNGRPMDLLVAAAVALVLGAAVAPGGQRAWRCGMSLMTSAVAMSSMLLGYVAVATPLVRYMPHEYQRIAIPWQPITLYAVVTFCIAWVLIRATKPPKVNDREPWSIPDVSADADARRRETTS